MGEGMAGGSASGISVSLETVAEETVLFTRAGGLGLITLNRVKALNALTLDQIHQIMPQMEAWIADPAVTAVVIEGAGEKAFCAGGDIRSLYDSGTAGDVATLARFYFDEYRLNRRIKTCPKPYVALLDGITMGGGVGLSVHGTWRVATERTLFAMPETGIGLFPDVGGTFFLPRCPGRLGLYLALTGARLKAADSLYAGIATHYVPTASLPALKTALADCPTADAVEATLRRFHQDPGPAPLADLRASIDRLFAADSFSALIRNLEADPDPWAAATLATLRQKSPLSLAVTFRQMQEGLKRDFDACMQLEFRLALHMAPAPDFLEGVRAVIIDKDNTPRWQPARWEDLEPAAVERVFGPTAHGELHFEP